MASLNAILGVGLRNLAGPGAAAFVRDSTKVQASAQKTAASVTAMSTSMKTAGTAAKSAATSMMAMFGVTAGLGTLVLATKAIAGFEETMVQAGKVSRATGETFERMTEQAKMLGQTTRFTAEDAASGLLFLGRAGFEAEDAMKALPATLNLAQAGVLGLGDAADMASNIVKQFQLTAAETVRVVDTLVIVSNRSNTSVSQLGEALAYAGPVANAVGLSVEQAASAIGVLGDAGIQASLAGTALRGVFAALLGPTGKAKAAFKEMDLEMGELDLQGEGLVATFEKLAASGLDAEKAVAIFGRRQAAAALVMADSAGRMRELEIATIVARGEANEMARAMDDTLKGSLLATKSAFEGLMISTGDRGLTGALRGSLDVLTGVLRTLGGMSNTVEKFRTVVMGLTAAVVVLTARFAALMALKLIAFFGGLTVSVLGAGSAMAALGVAATNLGGPLGLIAAVIGVATAAIFEMNRRQQELQANMEASAQAVEDFNAAMRNVARADDPTARLAATNDAIATLGETFATTQASIAGFGSDTVLKPTYARKGGAQPFFEVPRERTAKEIRELENLRTRLEESGREFDEVLRLQLNGATALTEGLGKSVGKARELREVFDTTGLESDQLKALNAESQALMESLDIAEQIQSTVANLEKFNDSAKGNTEEIKKSKAQIKSLTELLKQALPESIQASQFKTLADLLKEVTKQAQSTGDQLKELNKTAGEEEGRDPLSRLRAGLKDELSTLGLSNDQRKIQNVLTQVAKDMGVELRDLTEDQLEIERERVKSALEAAAAKDREVKALDFLKTGEESMKEQLRIQQLRNEGKLEEADRLQFINRMEQQFGEEAVAQLREKFDALADIHAQLEATRRLSREDDSGPTTEEKIENLSKSIVARTVSQIQQEVSTNTSLQATLDALASGMSAGDAEEVGQAALRQSQREMALNTAIAEFEREMRQIDPDAPVDDAQRKIIEDRINLLHDEIDARAALQKQVDEGLAASEKRASATEDAKDMVAALVRENERLEMSNGRLIGSTGALTESEKFAALIKDAKIGATQEEIASLEQLLELFTRLQEANVGLKQSQEELREFERLTGRIEQAMTDMFVSIIKGTESVEEGFKKLALSISEMILQQIIANQIVGPLMGAISPGLAPGGGGGTPAQSRLGNVFEDGSLQRFAYGGIVNRPIEFPMADGQRGLMGEAGPEAILPLQRDAGGRLGVVSSGGGEQKTVNVNMTVNTPDADSFKRSRSQILNRIRSGSRGI